MRVGNPAAIWPGPHGGALVRCLERLHDGHEVSAEIRAIKVALPKHLVALLKVGVPAETVELVRRALALDDEAKRALGALRRVRQPRRQQENLALADFDELAFAALDDWQLHVALNLPEEFGARLEVEVGARVRAADAHHGELRLVEQLVADWREECGGVGLAPGGEVGGADEEWWEVGGGGGGGAEEAAARGDGGASHVV